MKHNESGIPSSNKPTTLVVGYKEDVISEIRQSPGDYHSAKILKAGIEKSWVKSIQ
ncbi:MAG: hypothetical protein WC613_04350 [Candidatus Aenigmatarchaeota archaeon]